MGLRWMIGLCWLPPVAYGAVSIYVGRYDGWGAWAAAPLLLGPLVLSLAWAVWGVALLVREPRGRQGAMTLTGATLLGASPLLMVLVRALLR